MLEQQFVNALSLGCVYALFALGFTLIFGVLGVINLGHGAVFMVGAYAALELITHLNLPLWLAIIAAMMAALEVREKQISRSEHLLRKVWRDNFEAQFLRALPGATILGHNQPRLWNTVSALMPDGDRKSQWVVRLDKAGFAISTGSACTTGKEEPSHVLSAMGYKSAHALRAVRMSAGWATNEADWEALLKAVVKVHGDMQAKA